MKLLSKLLNPPVSRNEYADLVMHSLSASGIGTVRYYESTFSLKTEPGAGTIYLENGFATYNAAAKKDRTTVLENFVAGVSAINPIPADFKTAALGLLPILRSESYYGLARLMVRANEEKDSDGLRDLYIQKIAGELVAGLAYDSPQSITTINQDELRKWNTSFDEAMKIAIDNLRDRTDAVGLEEVAPGIFLGKWADSYEASRMLLPDMIHRLPVHVDPVAFVPNRSDLWITGSENIPAIKTILEIGEESHFAPYSLSPELYILRENCWKTFVPGDPMLRNMLLALRRKRDATDYNQQKQYLDAIHQKNGTDVFVASVLVFEGTGDRETSSACVLTNGVDSLLPLVEQIIFLVDPQTKDRIQLPWAEALPIVGNLLEEQIDLSPIRYRVRSFPTPEQINQLRTAARR